MGSREIAMEALGMASVQYNFFHKYLDDASYTKPSADSTPSLFKLLARIANDSRLDGAFKEPSLSNLDTLFEKYEDIVMEHWNSWALLDPVKQFEESQEAAVALLVATVPPGTHSYNFFIVHILTTSHAVRILLPFIPAKFHISLVREWWLLAISVYIAMMRPTIDPDYIDQDLKGRGWGYVQNKALNGPWATDAHFVKGERLCPPGKHASGMLSSPKLFVPSRRRLPLGEMYMRDIWRPLSGL